MRRIKDALASVVRFVILDPIREGSPQPMRWPWIGRLLGILVAAITLVALFYITFAGRIRGGSELLETGPDTYLPVVAMPLLGIGVFISITLLQTAALHVAWPLRLLALISLVGMVAIAFLISGGTAQWVAVGGFVGLVLLHLLRRGRGFTYLELVVVAILVFAITQVPIHFAATSADFGFDMRGRTIMMQLDQLNILAAPALIMAGTALTQISVSVGEGAAKVAARKLQPSTLTIMVAILLSVLSWQVISAVLGEPRAGLSRQFLWSFVILAFAILIAAPFVLRARRLGYAELGPGILSQRFGDIWFLVAAGSMLMFLPSFAMISVNAALTVNGIPVPQWASWLQAMTEHPYSTIVSRVSVAVIGLVVAWRRASRGRWLEGILLAAFLTPSLMLLLAQINPAAEWSHTPAARDAWLLVGIVLTTVYLAARGQLAGPRLASLLTAVAVMLVYPFRHILADPISYLLGSVAIAALIFGLVWRTLTEASFTRRGTKGLPQATRVLLFLANLVFASTALARGALTRGRGTMSDPAQWEWLGDVRFAEPLYISAVGLSLFAALVGPKWFTSRAAPVPSRTPVQPGRHVA